MTKPRQPDTHAPPGMGVRLWGRARAEAAGLVLCLAVALVAGRVAGSVEGLSSAATAIFLGFLIGVVLPARERFAPGIRQGSKGVLGLAIALMGLTIPTSNLPAGIQLGLLVVVMLLTLASAAALGRLFGVGTAAGLLGGMGTAVCGSAAIAASSGALRVKAHHTAAALASINLLSALGMVALPALAHFVGASSFTAGWWTGGSLQAVGQAVGAGFAFSPEAGASATAIKMFRVAMLAPLLVALTIGAGHGEGRKLSIPWFLPCFVAGAVFAGLSGTVVRIIPLDHSLIGVALAAIGLSIRPSELIAHGPRMLAICSLAFLVQFGGVLLLLAITR